MCAAGLTSKYDCRRACIRYAPGDIAAAEVVIIDVESSKRALTIFVDRADSEWLFACVDAVRSG